MSRTHEELSESHYELIDVLSQLRVLGAVVPSFRVERLSDHESEVWLKSEKRRLEHLARASGELHA